MYAYLPQAFQGPGRFHETHGVESRVHQFALVDRMDDGRAAQGAVHELVSGLEQRHVVLEVTKGRVLWVQVQLDRQRVTGRNELYAAGVRVRPRRSGTIHVAQQAQTAVVVVSVRVRLIRDRGPVRAETPVCGRLLLRFPYQQLVAFAVPAIVVLFDGRSIVMVL